MRWKLGCDGAVLAVENGVVRYLLVGSNLR